MFVTPLARRSTWLPRRRYPDLNLRLLLAEWRWTQGELLAKKEI